MLPIDKANHVIYGVAIYTLAAFLGTPLEAMLAVACAAIGKECWHAAQNRKATGNYLTGLHSVSVLDALATVAGGLLIYIPLLMK